jgi:hypothetical protein
MAKTKTNNVKSASPKTPNTTTAKAKAAAPATAKIASPAKAKKNPAATAPNPRTYPPELTRAIESFGNMAGYYVQCLPGDPTEKAKQVAGVVSGLQRILLASDLCPSGWMACNDGTCVPPGSICPS